MVIAILSLYAGIVYKTLVKMGVIINQGFLVLIGITNNDTKEIADVCICAPETETYKIQEYFLPVYHYLCAEVEKTFFPE
mgnify:CR=1 FL=1